MNSNIYILEENSIQGPFSLEIIENKSKSEEPVDKGNAPTKAKYYWLITDNKVFDGLPKLKKYVLFREKSDGQFSIETISISFTYLILFILISLSLITLELFVFIYFASSLFWNLRYWVIFDWHKYMYKEIQLYGTLGLIALSLLVPSIIIPITYYIYIQKQITINPLYPYLK